MFVPRQLIATLCLAIALIFTHSSKAAVVTTFFNHVFTGRAASGSLGGVSFANRNFTITGTVNPDDVIQSGRADYYVNHLGSWITINGIGTFEITTDLRTFIAGDINIVGLSRAGNAGDDLLDLNPNSAFAGWQLSSPIGNMSVTGVLIQWAETSNITPIETTGGIVVLNGPYPNGFFRSAAIPETSVALLLAGSCGLSLFRRRSRR